MSRLSSQQHPTNPSTIYDEDDLKFPSSSPLFHVLLQPPRNVATRRRIETSLAVNEDDDEEEEEGEERGRKIKEDTRRGIAPGRDERQRREAAGRSQ